jgi:hypothetical protein
MYMKFLYPIPRAIQHLVRLYVFSVVGYSLIGQPIAWLIIIKEVCSKLELFINKKWFGFILILYLDFIDTRNAIWIVVYVVKYMYKMRPQKVLFSFENFKKHHELSICFHAFYFHFISKLHLLKTKATSPTANFVATVYSFSIWLLNSWWMAIQKTEKLSFLYESSRKWHLKDEM